MWKTEEAKEYLVIVGHFLIEEVLEMLDEEAMELRELVRRPVGRPLVIEAREVPLSKKPEIDKVRN